MDIPVGITLKNDRDEEVTIRIPAGFIIESTQTEHRVQNIAAEKEYVFRLRSREQRKVIVYGRCLNRSRSEPKFSPGRVTPLGYAGSLDQSAIWQEVSTPKK